ncbi:uncharacterized protein LOC118413576 [Branchiostoma floridae]|uniref:Uncharacterized protein LOC118413576 n=1 Tax=Branchiostoma floridae TaxID=7739 RepID=A0A9J7MMW3_BRAFL|nr:uncharacterized protein LOC118413576 [Branchiostoma floridae]
MELTRSIGIMFLRLSLLTYAYVSGDNPFERFIRLDNYAMDDWNDVVLNSVTEEQCLMEFIDECNATIDKCSHGCTDLLDGYSCTCPPGWELSQADNTACVDVNECDTNKGNCSDICDNIDGSYQCTCPPGRRLFTDRLNCQKETLDIATAVYIRQISRLSEEHTNISLTIEYMLTWYDPRLQGIATTWVPVPRTMIWLPPLMFGKAVRGVTPVHEDTPAWVNSDGLTVYSMTRMLRVSCPILLTKYPFDTQTCNIKLHAYGGLRLNLIASDDVRYAAIKTDATGVVSQFELTGVDIQASFQEYQLNSTDCVFFLQKCKYNLDGCLFRRFPDCHLSDDCQQCTKTVGQCKIEPNGCLQGQTSTNGYTTVEVRLQMSRRLSSYAFRLFLPSAFVVTASYLQLWLPLHTSVLAGRASLGITGFLTIIVHGSGVGAVSWVNEVRAIDIWFAGCLTVVILMFLETIIVHFVQSQLEEKVRKKIAKREQNPPVRIPRPGFSYKPYHNVLEALGKEETSKERTPIGHSIQLSPIRIPRAKLKNPPNIMWYRLPDKRWIVIRRPFDGDLANAMLMTSIKARWREGPDGQFRMVSTDEPVNPRCHIPRPKLRVTPTVAWERKMDGKWKVVPYPGEDKIHVGWEYIISTGGWVSVYFTKEEFGATAEEDALEEKKIQRVADRIDAVARIVFPIMFAIFCVGFLLYYYWEV